MIYEVGEKTPIAATKQNLCRFIDAVLWTDAAILSLRHDTSGYDKTDSPIPRRTFSARISMPSTVRGQFERFFKRPLEVPGEDSVIATTG